eukprot:9139030-Pyramimonas_sp.AAC.1
MEALRELDGASERKDKRAGFSARPTRTTTTERRKRSALILATSWTSSSISLMRRTKPGSETPMNLEIARTEPMPSSSRWAAISRKFAT